VSFRLLHHPAGASAAVTGGIGPRLPPPVGAVRPRRRRGTLGRPGPPPVRFLGCSASPMCAFGRDLDGSGRSVDGRGRPPVRAAGPTPGGRRWSVGTGD